MQPADEIVQKDIADKAKVMEAQRKLLESRYDLNPRLDPAVKMSRGKPIAVGPTARLQATSHAAYCCRSRIHATGPTSFSNTGRARHPSSVTSRLC